MEKFKVVFEGFKSEAQAKAFAEWFENDGENTAELHLLETNETYYAVTDMDKYHVNGGFKPNKKNEIIVPLRFHKEE